MGSGWNAVGELARDRASQTLLPLQILALHFCPCLLFEKPRRHRRGFVSLLPGQPVVAVTDTPAHPPKPVVAEGRDIYRCRALGHRKVGFAEIGKELRQKFRYFFSKLLIFITKYCCSIGKIGGPLCLAPAEPAKYSWAKIGKQHRQPLPFF
jgi:hypothetical protein